MNQQIGPLSPAVPTARSAVRWVGFWASVVLPAAYPPILFAMNGTTLLATLLVLVVVNIGCLIAGHQYHS